MESIQYKLSELRLLSSLYFSNWLTLPRGYSPHSQTPWHHHLSPRAECRAGQVIGGLESLCGQWRGYGTQVICNDLNKFWKPHCHHVNYSVLINLQMVLRVPGLTASAAERRKGTGGREQDLLQSHPSHMHLRHLQVSS